MAFNLSSIFSLGGVLLSSGKTEQFIASVLVLEPLLADAIESKGDLGTIVASLQDIASKGDMSMQSNAAQNLIKMFAEVAVDPKQGPILFSTIRAMLGLPSNATGKRASLPGGRVGTADAFTDTAEAEPAEARSYGGAGGNAGAAAFNEHGGDTAVTGTMPPTCG